jgi:hypothetical protein
MAALRPALQRHLPILRCNPLMIFPKPAAFTKAACDFRDHRETPV